MKVTLTKVYRSTTNKDGSPLMSKAGKPYTRLSIKTDTHGDKYLSGFDGKQTASWKEGDSVDIDVEQKGEYLNFSVPKLPEGYTFPTQLQEELSIIKTMLGRIIGILEAQKDGETPKRSYHYPTPEEEGIDLSDLP